MGRLSSFAKSDETSRANRQRTRNDANSRRGQRHDLHCPPPVRPDARERHPDQPINRTKARPFRGGPLKDRELMPERENFRRELEPKSGSWLRRIERRERTFERNVLHVCGVVLSPRGGKGLVDGPGASARDRRCPLVHFDAGPSGAIRGKAPRQRRHSWHSWQCGLCNLQNPKGARETESVSPRQPLNQLFTPVWLYGVRQAPFKPTPRRRLGPARRDAKGVAGSSLCGAALSWTRLSRRSGPR